MAPRPPTEKERAEHRGATAGRLRPLRWAALWATCIDSAGAATGAAQSTRGAAFTVSPRTAVDAVFEGCRTFAKVEVPERTRGASINAPDAAGMGPPWLRNR